MTASPRIVLSRESVWSLPVPQDASQRLVLNDRRARVALAAYAVHTDAYDVRDFDAFVAPVMRTMASSRCRTVLTLVERPERFDAGRIRHLLQSARELGLASMVELVGTWSPILLELVAAASPTFVRLPPSSVQGVSSDPAIFRSLVTFAEFARARSLAIVARNPRDEYEVDAVRVAGIDLVQWASLPLEVEQSAPPVPRSLLLG